VDGYANFIAVDSGEMYGDNFLATGLTVTKVLLLQPNGGVISAGTPNYPIEWTAPPTATKFKLKYSLDNGLTWGSAHPEVPYVTGGSYPWSVPIPAKNKLKCLVKVIGYNDNNVKVGADISYVPFTIEVASITAPTATVPITIVPKGSLAYPVTWITNGISGVVTDAKVYYTFGSSGVWKLAAGTLVDALGTFSWDVPSPANPKKVKLKVVLKDASGNKVATAVSGTFRIE
jgi:hypothetical protein